MSEEDLIDIEEAARMLTVSKSTVKALVRDRKIPFVKLGYHTLRFKRCSLAAWIKRKEQQPTSLV
jgi:excisionase family DNA binding protein